MRWIKTLVILLLPREEVVSEDDEAVGGEAVQVISIGRLAQVTLGLVVLADCNICGDYYKEKVAQLVEFPFAKSTLIG